MRDAELAVIKGCNLGKLGPNTPGYPTPATADGFNDHRDEGDTLLLALFFGVLMAAFEVFVPRQRRIRVPDRISDRVQPQTAGDSEIPGSRGASPPPWDVDVSRAPGTRVGVVFKRTAVLVERARNGPLRKEPWLLKFRVEVSSGCRVEHHVAEQIVTTRAVTASTANEGMVAEAVHDPMAARALVVLFGERHAQPATEHSYEQRRLVV